MLCMALSIHRAEGLVKAEHGAQVGKVLRLSHFAFAPEDVLMDSNLEKTSSKNGGGKKNGNGYVVSGQRADRRMFEMLHDREKGTTTYAVWADGAWTIEAQINLGDGRTASPLSPENNLLTHKVVLFPSGPEEYGDKGQLIDAIRGYLHRYVDLSPEFERLASYYVLLSWLYDGYHEIPYLRVKGEPGCGKTRFLLILGSICYKPIFASGASTVSPLFRILDLVRGTVVMDEADFRYSDERAEAIKILNNGTMRGFPVLRTEVVGSGKEFNPRAYHVFGPKIIATRGPFEDRALETRCISEQMGTRPLRREIPISLSAGYEQEALKLRNQLLLFRFRTWRERGLGEDLVNRALDPRLNQMFAPLLSVVDDPDDRRLLEDLARTYQDQLVADRGMEVEGQLLQIIKDLWEKGDGPPVVQELALELDRCLGGGGKFTPRFVGHVLRGRLGIRTIRRNTGYAISPVEYPRLVQLYERYGIERSAEVSQAQVHHVHQIHPQGSTGNVVE